MSALDERVFGIYEEWEEHGAEEWADAMVASLKLGGVDHLFFTSGTELAFFQEAVLRAGTRGWPAPRLITMLHEEVSLSAALGASMVANQPSAAVAHVDVGLFNYGAAVHAAWRESYPVMIISGTGPRAYPGSMPGARDNPIQWYQEPRDQGEILRQYTKMDHRLEYQDNPGLMISRLLQVAMSEPKGPVYLAAPREMAMQKVGGSMRFPTRDQMGVARRAWPDPDDAKTVAGWLIKADNPAIYTSHIGRNPDAVPELVRLAELLALPVSCPRTASLNFPTTHDLYGTGPAPKDADALLIIESPIPFMPMDSPRPGAKIAWVDVDPVLSRFKTMEFRADCWLPVDGGAAARAIHDAATGLLTKTDMNKIEERRARLSERRRELERRNEDRAQRAAQRDPFHPFWVGHELGKLLEPDAIVVNDALTGSDGVQAFSGRTEPGTYFCRGASAGGWGCGAAFGAKLARPERDVIHTTGDGFYMFSNPAAALWSSEHYKAPVLTVVFVNGSYGTGTGGARRSYPDGVMARTGNYEGGVFLPPPDFAKLAEAGNGYGETVREAEGVGPALRRGLDQVRKGSPAVIAMMIPSGVDEMTLPEV